MDQTIGSGNQRRVAEYEEQTGVSRRVTGVGRRQ